MVVRQSQIDREVLRWRDTFSQNIERYCRKMYSKIVMLQNVHFLPIVWTLILLYAIFSFMCMFCRSLFVLSYFFLLVIVLSVLLQFTDSDYSFDIFKHFLSIRYIKSPGTPSSSVELTARDTGQRRWTARDTGQRRCRHPIRNQPKYLLFFILCVN